MIRSQSGNSAGRDIIGGDQTNHYYARPSALSALYERLRKKNADEEYTSKIAEKLQHFCAASDDGDLRGLEEKLTAANRPDLVAPARRMKEDAAKLVMRLQTSPIAQDILTMILSKIYTDFMLHVTPAVQADRSRAEIDELISSKVINPAMEMLGENDLVITETDILGLMFFLAGNCHVRWDKC